MDKNGDGYENITFFATRLINRQFVLVIGITS